MDMVKAILAQTELPPIEALGYEYVVAGNGLFIRAENAWMEACVPVAPATLHGLTDVEPYARLKVERVPSEILDAIYASALSYAPMEIMYFGIRRKAGWFFTMPEQITSPVSVDYSDVSNAVIDLHSHGHAPAFFSDTDDADEAGLRFYAVIGDLGGPLPTLCARAGVYGHHWPVPVTALFDGPGPFTDNGSPFDALKSMRSRFQ